MLMLPGLLRDRGRANEAVKALPDAPRAIDFDTLSWTLGLACSMQHKPFDPALLRKQFPPPATTETIIRAAQALGFRIRAHDTPADAITKAGAPCLVLMRPDLPPGDAARTTEQPPLPASVGLVTGNGACGVVLLTVCGKHITQLPLDQFAARYLGTAFVLGQEPEPVDDPGAHEQRDQQHAETRPDTYGAHGAGKVSGARFGFHWFIPALLQHRSVWRDVLLASLVLQILALGTPLFTQAIIDKVVVHRTESTLLVIAAGMALFTLFSALLNWVRQYLVLHTGNRVDAVLGAAVFERLLKLPLRWFESRPTGVIAARLQGVEVIREFIATAAVTLALDLPFLLIFVAAMFWYSVTLTLLALAIISAIAVLSLVVAPLFQTRLDRQFLLGARNQAFMTEHVAGIETVKALQMEPRLRARHGDYLAQYMHASFSTRQLGNTYHTLAGALEQALGVLILLVGAWTVMTTPEFTIGMLVAFQMFAGKLSQPMMRLVGLWQQFQQASLSVKRLRDVMDTPIERHAISPTRSRGGPGLVKVQALAFRHGPRHPWLYRNLDLTLEPGSVTALMGPSGCGKSTLAKLLQGFYQPSDGRILIDGIDIANLPANELRQVFGVVPQETVLFSGTVYDNLIAAEPDARLEDVVAACKLADIHDTIEQMPDGYRARIGERGTGLSGGQRQRLAIARALLKRPQVLIFDEASSALDAETAARFAATVNQFRGRISMLFITHALPAGLIVDQVVHIAAPDTIAPAKNG